jgi:hypothetical protein
VRTAAEEIRQSADLKAARAAFGRLGDAILSQATRSGSGLGPGVKVAYCPMAQKYWLQKGNTVQNPFYGKQMLDCGRFTTNIPALKK